MSPVVVLIPVALLVTVPLSIALQHREQAAYG